MATPAVAPVRQPIPQRKTGVDWRALAAWLCMLLVVVIAITTLHSYYRFGINETDDSAVYLSTADSPLEGARLTFNVGEPAGTPLTHYPPLYPILLMLGRSLTGNFLHAAAAIDVLSYLCCCAGAYWFVRRYAPREWALAAVVLVLCSASVYYVHSLVSPDGPALALMTVSMCLLASYIGEPRTRTLVWCSVVLAVALLLRYVCAAYVGAACLTVLCFEHAPLKRRLRSTVLLGVLSGAPLGCVLLTNLLLGGNPTDRSVRFHPVTAAGFGDLIEILSAVFLPYRLPLWTRGVGLCLAGAVLIWIAIKKVRVGEAVRIAGTFLAVYIGFLFVSISFFDAATPFDERILAPALLLMCVLFALAGCALWESGRWVGRIFAVALLLVSMTFGAAHATAFLRASAQTRSTASLQRQYSALLPMIDALPKNAVIFSNVPFDIYLATGRHARTVPRVVGYTELKPLSQAQVEARVRSMRDQVEKSNGLIVYKRRPPTLWDAGLLKEPELQREVPGLVKVSTSGPFAVYVVH